MIHIYIEYLYLWRFPLIGIPHNHPKLAHFSTQRRPQATGPATPFSFFFCVGWGGCSRPGVLARVVCASWASGFGSFFWKRADPTTSAKKCWPWKSTKHISYALCFYKNALKTHETPFAKLLPRMNVHHENDSLITMQGCELVNFLLVLSFFNSRQQKPKKREIVKVGFLNFWVPSTAKRRTLQHQQFHVITFMWLLYMTSNYRSWLWRLHMATKIRGV